LRSSSRAAEDPRLRLFFAIWPEPELAERLARWANEAAEATRGRIARAENIHLTMAFLGEVAEPRLADAQAAARRVRAQRCDLRLEEARYWRHNRIVWVGPRETPAPLAALAEDLQRELEAEGFRLEARPFQVHITLIRNAHAPRELPALPAPSSLDWPVREFLLVRSNIERDGARYEVLERYACSA
jgi:2'-5' RNA ligase